MNIWFNAPGGQERDPMMAQAYEIGPIEDEQIDSAYLLARLAVPSLELDSWRDRCRRLSGRAADEILVASNPRGYVQGLAISAVTLERLGAPVLDVSSFVVVSAADGPGVGVELFDHLARRARRAGCASIRVHLLDLSERQLPVDATRQEIDALLRASSRSVS
jgi:GNAT superfamily N-acetyltransferase